MIRPIHKLADILVRPVSRPSPARRLAWLVLLAAICGFAPVRSAALAAEVEAADGEAASAEECEPEPSSAELPAAAPESAVPGSSPAAARAASTTESMVAPPDSAMRSEASERPASSTSGVPARALPLGPIAAPAGAGFVVPRWDPAAEQVEEAPKTEARLELVLFGNIEGELADVGCRDEWTAGDLIYAAQAGFFRQREESAEANGALAPVAINAGDSVFPGALGRYLLSARGRGARDFARILARIPYAAHAMGNHDLEAPREELLPFLESAADAGLHLQAANLRCEKDKGAEPLCRPLGNVGDAVPFRIIERGPLRIAVASVLDPKTSGQVAQSRLQGVSIEPPENALATLVPQMREAGADLVVIVLHQTSKQPGEAAQALASRLEGIDLLITNGLFPPVEVDTELDFEATRPAGFLVAPRTRSFLIGADGGSRRAIVADLEARRTDEGRWRIVRLEPRLVPTDQVAPDPETAQLLDKVVRSYCEDWGKPIRPGLELAQAFDLKDLQTFILNVMRFETGSEIALANAGTFRNHHRFPLTDTLTRADLLATMPYGDELETFEIPGSALQDLAKKIGSGLVAEGLQTRDGSVLVNGRPIDKNRLYQVAANQYLVEGGGDLVDPKKIKAQKQYQPSWADSSPTIVAVVERFIESGRYAGQGTAQLSPDKNFPDLQDKFLWSYIGSVNATYNRVAVTNPSVDGAPAYDKSRLTSTSSDVINAELKAAVRADRRNHGWDNDVLLQYATARVQASDGTEPSFEETKDVVRARSAYKFQGLRAATGDRWWAPIPFAEAQAETELTRPDDRTWHLFELTGIAGTMLRLMPALELKLGANLKRDVVQPDGETTFGLSVGYKLTRFDLFTVLGKPVQLESELEYFFNSIGHDNLSELRSLSQVYFAISDRLFFTATYSAYFYRTRQVRMPGRSNDVTVGLNFLWDTAVQSF